MITVGKRPDKEDAFWEKVASEMMPEKTIDRLDSHGKYLFSIVSIIGTLLTGFSIFGPVSIPFNPLLLLPVALVCMSLALGMLGITPRVEGVNRNDFISVKNHYNKLIKRRGCFISLAGICFAASLFSVAIVLISSTYKTSSTNAIISARLTGNVNNAMLNGKVEFSGLPHSAIANVKILGFGRSNNIKNLEPALLFEDVSRADSSGKLTIAPELDQLIGYERFQILASVKSGSKIIREERIEIKR